MLPTSSPGFTPYVSFEGKVHILLPCYYTLPISKGELQTLTRERFKTLRTDFAPCLPFGRKLHIITRADLNPYALLLNPAYPP
jgi:hypothetical protein